MRKKKRMKTEKKMNEKHSMNEMKKAKMISVLNEKLGNLKVYEM